MLCVSTCELTCLCLRKSSAIWTFCSRWNLIRPFSLGCNKRAEIRIVKMVKQEIKFSVFQDRENTKEAAVSANKADLNQQCSEVKTQSSFIDVKWSSGGRCLQQEPLKTCQRCGGSNHAGLAWKMQTSHQTVFSLIVNRFSQTNIQVEVQMEKRLSLRERKTENHTHNHTHTLAVRSRRVKCGMQIWFTPCW